MSGKATPSSVHKAVMQAAPCPFCGAPVDTPCRTRNGEMPSWPHKARTDGPGGTYLPRDHERAPEIWRRRHGWPEDADRPVAATETDAAPAPGDHELDPSGSWAAAAADVGATLSTGPFVPSGVTTG